MSPSPDRRHMPPPSHSMRGSSPYPDEQYTSARPPPHGHYSPPPSKKNVRREPDRFERGLSPGMMRHSDVSPHEDRISHREMPTRAPAPHHHSHVPDNRNDIFARPTSMPPKRPTPVPTREERYSPSPPPSQYSAQSDKRYALSLNERFSAVVETARSEPRIKYTREDLEKITIDIHRNIKEPSPTRRHIVNPNDVKLVHRPTSGSRPMFDRDEIKQASRDMREDAYYEKKTVGSNYTIDPRSADNYEITRQRFDTQSSRGADGRGVDNRWQGADVRKESLPMDQDDREREYERPNKRTYDSRPKSQDRDFRSERYAVNDAPSRGRAEYSTSSQRRMVSPPPEPRNHRENINPDVRRKVGPPKMSRMSPPPQSYSRSRYPPPEKHYSESFPPRGEKVRSERRSPTPEEKWPPRREEGYARKPEKYYRGETSSRNSSYFEAPERRPSEPYRGRGSRPPPRGYRGGSRGYRGRGSRGSPRGSSSFPPRGSSYRGGFRGSTRGRGAPRRGRMSPGFWEHDKYSPEMVS